MITKVIKIGTSLGLIIPSTIVKGVELQIGTQIEIVENANKDIMIKKLQTKRSGWGAAFEKYAKSGMEEKLLPDFLDTEVDQYL